MSAYVNQWFNDAVGTKVTIREYIFFSDKIVLWKLYCTLDVIVYANKIDFLSFHYIYHVPWWPILNNPVYITHRTGLSKLI